MKLKNVLSKNYHSKEIMSNNFWKDYLDVKITIYLRMILYSFKVKVVKKSLTTLKIY